MTQGILAAGISILAVVASQQAAAQTVAAPAPAESAGTPSQIDLGIPEIVVTAQKRSENINKVGISINAVSAETLKASGITSTADLVKVVSGFNFTPSAYGTPVYALRGIGFYETSLAASPTVSLYVDEVPLPLSIMSIAANLDVERVEVLKGPQGTLFGQNSTAGAINYIAAKPTSDWHYGGDVTYGRFNRGGASAFISGPVSDTLKMRAAVRWDHSGDWQYSYTRNDRRGEGNVLAGRLLLDWTPTDRLSVNLNVNGFEDKSDNQAAQFIAAASARSPAALSAYPLPPANDRAADWDAGHGFRRNVRFYQISARVDYTFSDAAKLTSISAFDQLDRKSQADADGTALPTFDVATPGRAKNFSQEIRLSGKTGGAQYVVGASYAHDNIEDEGSVLDSSVSSLPFKAARGVANQTVNTYAVFGNLDYKILSTVTLTGGIRYTNQKRSFSGCTYDSGAGDAARLLSGIATALSHQTVVIPAGGCVTLGTNFLPGVQHLQLNQDNVSWRAGVNWEIGQNALLYANVSRGYKSGSFPAIGAVIYSQYAPAVQESVLAYEAGYKLTVLDRKLQLNGAGFYYDYDNKQTRGKVPTQAGLQNALINVPKSRIVGFELQAIARPIRGLTFNVGVTYSNTKIRGDFVNVNGLGVSQNFRDQSLPLTPRWQANIDGQYEFALSSGFDAFVGGNMNHQGKTNGALGGQAMLDIPAYTLFDARLGVKSPGDRWQAMLFARNLTNKYYATLVNLPGSDAVVRYTGMPRTYGVTLSYRY